MSEPYREDWLGRRCSLSSPCILLPGNAPAGRAKQAVAGAIVGGVVAALLARSAAVGAVAGVLAGWHFSTA